MPKKDTTRTLHSVTEQLGLLAQSKNFRGVFVISEPPATVSSSVLVTDCKDIEAEALTVATFRGTAPPATWLTISIRFDASFDTVAVVLLLAMKAPNQNRDGWRAERIACRVEGIFGHRVGSSTKRSQLYST
jgi:hypothetical protein